MGGFVGTIPLSLPALAGLHIKHESMATKKVNGIEDEGWAPKDYKLPESNSFMKFVNGKNKFRIMSPLTTGYEYWTEDNKPIRSPEPFTETPGIKVDPKTGKDTQVNHFWSVVVWDYATDSLKMLEITQKGIQKYVLGLVNDPDWGKPQDYDIVVTREGEGLLTKYTVAANPHKEMPAEVVEAYEASDLDPKSLFEE